VNLHRGINKAGISYVNALMILRPADKLTLSGVFYSLTTEQSINEGGRVMGKTSYAENRAIATRSYRIRFKDYVSECSTNEQFKDIIESGNFVFVDGRLVINDDKYVDVDNSGNILLWYLLKGVSLGFS